MLTAFLFHVDDEVLLEVLDLDGAGLELRYDELDRDPLERKPPPRDAASAFQSMVVTHVKAKMADKTKFLILFISDFPLC